MKKKRSVVDLDSLKEFFMAISSTAPDFSFLGNNNDSLYHYTDLGGLKGIIESKDIWLTNSRYSNDDEEITYGYGVVKEVVDEHINASTDPVKQDFPKKLSELVKEPTAGGIGSAAPEIHPAVEIEPASDEIYTCSFCLKDNLLSQWRGYSANGTGVSIAFDPTKFNDVLGIDSPKGLLRLWKVFYRKATQKDIISHAIEFFYDKPILEDEKLSRASDAIQFFIPTFKHEGFAEEEECRMIFTPPPGCNPKPRFRVAKNMLIPYYTLQDLVKPDSFEMPVTKVKIGPSMNKLLNKQSVRMLLNDHDFGTVTIETADIPYRG